MFSVNALGLERLRKGISYPAGRFISLDTASMCRSIGIFFIAAMSANVKAQRTQNAPRPASADPISPISDHRLATLYRRPPTSLCFRRRRPEEAAHPAVHPTLRFGLRRGLFDRDRSCSLLRAQRIRRAFLPIRLPWILFGLSRGLGRSAMLLSQLCRG